MVFWGLGVRKGVVCECPSTTLDIVATVLDYAGIAASAGMDSRSLRPYLEGKSDKHRDHVLSGLGSWRMVIQERYKYVRGFGAEPLLFDRFNDPLENENLVGTKPAAADRLSRILDAEGFGGGRILG